MMLGPIASWFRGLTLARKLSVMAISTSGLAILVVSSVVVIYDRASSRDRLVRDTDMLAEVVGANSTAALAFNDTRSARQTLAAVAVNGHVASAMILLPDGTTFAEYNRTTEPSAIRQMIDGKIVNPGQPSHTFTGSSLLVTRPIVLSGETVGTVVVQSDLTELTARALAFGQIIGLAVLMTFGVVWVVSSRLRRVIASPLLQLTAITTEVSRDRRYDIRAVKQGNDEIGALIDGFNEMLSEIQRRDKQLLIQQDDLEQTIDDRMTDLRAANSDLTEARDKAMEASRAKSEFLANMSHEIRTPMNGIIGMTELALDSSLTAEQRDCLTTVKVSAESLLAILNDILDFSKIESRKLELESVPFSLRDVVDEVLKPLAVTAHQKGIELLADVGPDVPLVLTGDPVRLRQVLGNLLGNAVKFTERGHVLLEITEDDHREEHTTLHFRVVDTGIGISPEKHATIFEAFSQADGSTTRRFGGTGLGLTISATLVHLMDGRIWVESEPGRGSTFHFTASYHTADPLPLSPQEPRLEGLRVLIVDDNQINRRILREQLTRWRMKPTAVDGGQAAVEALAAATSAGDPFVLMLLDANMPDLDGFGVAEQVASRPDLSGAAIIMLTSSGQYGDIARCRELGISAYLTKPVKGADLFDALLRVLEPDRRAAVAGGSDAVPDGPRQPVKVLLAEDNVVNQRVAVGLLTRRGHDVTVASNGREALDAIERATFDIVLMDVQMPEMGGLEATAAIRAREKESGGHLRIVAMTAHAMAGDRERCLEAGMDAYLAKPIDRELLFAAVEQTGDVPVRVTPLPVNRAEVLERLGGDQELFDEVIRLFLEDCPQQLVALKEALDAGDAARIRSTAHALKGASGSMGAAMLSEHARIVEQLGADGNVEAARAVWERLSAEAATLLGTLKLWVASEKQGV